MFFYRHLHLKGTTIASDRRFRVITNTMMQDVGLVHRLTYTCCHSPRQETYRYAFRGSLLTNARPNRQVAMHLNEVFHPSAPFMRCVTLVIVHTRLFGRHIRVRNTTTQLMTVIVHGVRVARRITIIVRHLHRIVFFSVRIVRVTSGLCVFGVIFSSMATNVNRNISRVVLVTIWQFRVRRNSNAHNSLFRCTRKVARRFTITIRTAQQNRQQWTRNGRTPHYQGSSAFAPRFYRHFRGTFSLLWTVGAALFSGITGPAIVTATNNNRQWANFFSYYFSFFRVISRRFTIGLGAVRTRLFSVAGFLRGIFQGRYLVLYTCFRFFVPLGWGMAPVLVLYSKY